MKPMDNLTSIPLRRADTRDSQVIQIGFTPTTTGHKGSKSLGSPLTAPVWIWSQTATISELDVRSSVAKRLHKAERDVLPNDLWDTLYAESLRREGNNAFASE